MKVLHGIIKVIEKVTDILSGYLQAGIIFFLMVMLLAEVLTRYILRSPLSIADEMGGYLLVAITFHGVGLYMERKGACARQSFDQSAAGQIRAAAPFYHAFPGNSFYLTTY